MPHDDELGSREPSPRATALYATLLIALHLGLVVHAAVGVDWTADEPNYVGAGRALWRDFGFVTPVERFHGPLPFLANQLFVDGEVPLDLAAVRVHARLGMLPFVLLLLFAVGGFARELFGRCGMLLSLTLAAACPLLCGYGALVAVDVALAATGTLAFWALWRHGRCATGGRAGAAGLALGIALATKYLALLFVPCFALAVAVAAWRHGGLRAAIAQGLALAAAALLALWACYGFAAPGLGDAPAFVSAPFAALARTPLLLAALHALPGPFVLGIDFQLGAAGNYAGRFLDVEGGHPAYYAVTLLTKLPLPTLVILAAAFVLRAPRVPGLVLTVLLPGLGVFAYLSLSRMQLGARYVLPLVPLLYVFAGRLAASRGVLASRGAAMALVGLLLWLVGERVVDAPNHLSWFHQLVGRSGGMAIFADSNCDWGQGDAEGRRVLAARHGSLEFLGHDDGPRFGTLARYVAQRKRSDPMRQGHTYDWLARFTPIDRHLAAWLVYEVGPEDFASAIAAGDQRAARELVLAFVHAERIEDARGALAAIPVGPEREALAAMLTALSAALASPQDSALALAAIRQLAAFRLFRSATRLLDALPPEHDALRWSMLWDAGRMPELRKRLLAERARRPLRDDERFILAQSLLWSGRFVEAKELLDAAAGPPAESPLHPAWAALAAQVEREAAQQTRLFLR